MLVERLRGECSIDSVLAAVEARPGGVFLDSGSHDYGLGRYSIFASDPFKELVGWGSSLEIRESGERSVLEGDIFELLRKELAKLKGVDCGSLPFAGGAIGCFAYDAGRRIRPASLEKPYSRSQPEMRFGFYDAALVWDHEQDSLFAIASGAAEDPTDAMQRLKSLVLQSEKAETEDQFQVGDIESNFSREVYLERVGKMREYIREGEIYQANLSQRFRASFQGSGAALYRRLREVNPAPYAAYLNFGDEEILSSSPERFLRLDDGVVNTRPIKGTRPRGANVQEEESFREELAASEKDRAELLMIVDLERNDLGRVCKPGTISVKTLFGLETYASVIHQTATVEGRLEEGRDAIDCIEAMFPGGSITGAPKIRAMEVIDELETENRGVYTGAIGYIGFDGRADFNIAIRTMRISDGELSFNVGGGIVWDSDPKSEYEETLHKARSLFEALGAKQNVG